ncbi:MAG: hypothetical protein ABI411_02605 [Tahibacter sp.]
MPGIEPVDGIPHAGGRSDRYWNLSLLLLACCVSVWAAWRIQGVGLTTDEFVHFPRIVRLLHGDFALWDQYSAMLPGYHALVAAALSFVGADSLNAARLISLLFGLAAVAAFCSVRTHTDAHRHPLLVAQFLVFPLAFPFVFLVYTDIASLAFVTGAFAFATVRRHWLAATLMILAIAVRQNNVLWLALLALQSLGPHVHWSEKRIDAAAAASVSAPYLFPATAFVAFWLWNGSISAPNPQAALNPDISLHLGNPFFLLFVAGILFPLHVLVGLRDAFDRFRQRPWLWSIPLLLFAGCWWGFNADHPLNAPATGYELFLRARLFSALNADPWLRILFGTVVVAAACGLASMSRLVNSAWVLYPTSLLYLTTLWMIDVRYLLIPATLWLATRRLSTPRIERATCIYWIILSCALFESIAEGKLFP